MVNTFPRGEQRTDEVEDVSWLWDPSRAWLGLKTVSRTTRKEMDESGATEDSHCHDYNNTSRLIVLHFCLLSISVFLSKSIY